MPRRFVLALTLALGLLLSACDTDPFRRDVAALPSWTQAEIDAVLDLSELGELHQLPDGRFTVGGRLLGPELVVTQPHGRSVNLLRLDDDTLNALSPEARRFFMDASAAELKRELRRYGLTPADVRAAQAERPDGRIALPTFVHYAQLAAIRSGSPELLRMLDLEAER